MNSKQLFPQNWITSSRFESFSLQPTINGRSVICMALESSRPFLYTESESDNIRWIDLYRHIINGFSHRRPLIKIGGTAYVRKHQRTDFHTVNREVRGAVTDVPLPIRKSVLWVNYFTKCTDIWVKYVKYTLTCWKFQQFYTGGRLLAPVFSIMSCLNSCRKTTDTTRWHFTASTQTIDVNLKEGKFAVRKYVKK